jgi:hypothetical protein
VNKPHKIKLQILLKISKKDKDFLPDFVQDALSKASFYGSHQLQSGPGVVLLNFTFLADDWAAGRDKREISIHAIAISNKGLAISNKGSCRA